MNDFERIKPYITATREERREKEQILFDPKNSNAFIFLFANNCDFNAIGFHAEYGK